MWCADFTCAACAGTGGGAVEGKRYDGFSVPRYGAAVLPGENKKLGASMAKLVRRHTSNVEIISSNLVGSIQIFFGPSFF